MLEPGDLCMYAPGDPRAICDLYGQHPSDLYLDAMEPTNTITQKDVLIYLETYLTKPNGNGRCYRWHKVIHGELVGWMAGHLEPVNEDG